ncbi:MAG: M42 family metallopeptidase [Thermoleophilia bacterium]
MADLSLDDVRDLLARYANAHGVSGYENSVGALLKEDLEQLTDEVRSDTMGNVIGTRQGTGPSVMIAAHMDEIGLMVKYVDDNGFLRFVPIGGWFDQMLLGQRVFVHGDQGPVPGVIGSKPPHILEQDERNKVIKIKEMFIDVGAPDADGARALGLEVGSPVTLDRELLPLANGYVTGKAFDDRAGVAMMVGALRLLQGEDISARVYAVGTVQEEVGLKGARTSAYGLEPDVALISEVTIPGDHPGVTPEQRHIKTGEGPVLTVADASGRGIMVQRRVVDWLRSAADSAGIAYQLDVGSGGTTDATAIHLTKTGIPSGVVSVSTRYIHSPIEVLKLDDLAQGARLIAQAIRRAAESF